MLLTMDCFLCIIINKLKTIKCISFHHKASQQPWLQCIPHYMCLYPELQDI